MGRLITSVLLFLAHCCAFATAPDPSVASQLSTLTRNSQITFSGNLRAPVTNLTVNGQAGTVYQDLTYAVPGLGLADGSNFFSVEISAPSGLRQTNTVASYLPAAVSFAYDDNGNLTSDGLRFFEYDDLDRLMAVTVSNAWRSEFAHDALWRRRATRAFTWDNGWMLTNEICYVYSGRQVIQERDALNQVLVTYTLGQSLTPLARTTPPSALNAKPSTAFYHADGNLNITALVNTEGFIQARYLYDPYGNLLAKSGPLADANLYRFSSKPIHTNSGLYYYGFRFYEPNLQRWLNHDPIGERGGINLYAYVDNNPVNWVDLFGLDIWVEGPSGGEPNAHQSINVGDPLGDYYSQSFGTDGLAIWNAGIYEDGDKGGPIEKYLKTTPEQDAEFLKHLQDDYNKDEKKWYGPSTCRTYSQDEFEKARKKYGGKESTPPKRKPAPRTFLRRMFSSSNSSSTTTSSSGTGSSR